MKALISKLEPRKTGYRVVQANYDDQIFPLAEDLFWTDFPTEYNVEEIIMDAYWYDPLDSTIKLMQEPQNITKA